MRVALDSPRPSTTTCQQPQLRSPPGVQGRVWGRWPCVFQLTEEADSRGEEAEGLALEPCQSPEKGKPGDVGMEGWAGVGRLAGRSVLARSAGCSHQAGVSRKPKGERPLGGPRSKHHCRVNVPPTPNQSSVQMFLGSLDSFGLMKHPGVHAQYDPLPSSPRGRRRQSGVLGRTTMNGVFFCFSG